MDRLNLQHYLWKDQTGYLLHPSISLSEIENPKIADVGTGTGYVHCQLNQSKASHLSDWIHISCLRFLFFKQNHRAKNSNLDRIWLLDLARTISPTAQLDGFDIDISGCPQKLWLPPNVTMRQLDALGEIPEHLVGVYDIVHLRLFQVVVKDNDPGPLLRNMLRMLSGWSNLLVYIHTLAFIFALSIALIPHILPSCPSFEVSLVNSDTIRLHITSTNAHIQYTEPGGHLQWAEYDMTSQTTIKAHPSLSSSALDAIPAFVQGFKKMEKHGRVGTQKYLFNSLYISAPHHTSIVFLPQIFNPKDSKFRKS